MTASWHVVAKLLTVHRMTKVDYHNKVFPVFLTDCVRFIFNMTYILPPGSSRTVRMSLTLHRMKVKRLHGQEMSVRLIVNTLWMTHYCSTSCIYLQMTWWETGREKWRRFNTALRELFSTFSSVFTLALQDQRDVWRRPELALSSSVCLLKWVGLKLPQ